MTKTRAQRRREKRAKEKSKNFSWKLEIGPTFDNAIEAIEYMEQLLQEPDAELLIVGELENDERITK